MGRTGCRLSGHRQGLLQLPHRRSHATSGKETGDSSAQRTLRPTKDYWILLPAVLNLTRKIQKLGEKKTILKDTVGTSLVVQWLRLCFLNTGGLQLIPGLGARFHMPQLPTKSYHSTTRSCKQGRFKILSVATKTWSRPKGKIKDKVK